MDDLMYILDTLNYKKTSVVNCLSIKKMKEFAVIICNNDKMIKNV